MTNEELKALCLQVECSSFERDVAESILRLLRENEAMRGVVDASIAIVQAHYIDATCKDCTGETSHIHQLLEKIEQFQKM